VTKEEEEIGLDKEEHGTESYADFEPRSIFITTNQNA
jgi:Amt family ammonium transporter